MNSSRKQQNFRLDIQVLRALAVISVLLYHFKFDRIMGGFVGVDIFFVISGYLISKSILNSQAKDKFNLTTFYFNRIKRLYPALIMTILATYIAGFFILFPNDFSQLSASTIFASIGISNIYYWFTTGYFDLFAGSEPPLLHTWSLSVEFQFYLIWPLILLLLRKKPKWQFIIISTVTILSAIIAVLYIKYDASGAFYLTPFRIHEFSIGAIIVLLERRLEWNKTINTFIVLLGYVLIFMALLTFNSDQITFPGIYAWLPIIGSAIVILTGRSTYLNRAFTFKPFVFIGEISYSLYLVHWPLLIFFTYNTYHYSSSLRNSLLIYSLILASLLYYFVEKPFRKNIANISPVKYTLICQVLVIATMLLGISTVIGKGWVWRLPEASQAINNVDIKEMQAYTWFRQKPYSAKTAYDNNGKEKILLIGDSQGADIINLLYESGKINNYDLIYREIKTHCGLPYVDPIERQEYYLNNPMILQQPNIATKCDEEFDRLIENPSLFTEADKIYIALNWHDFAVPNLESSIDKIISLVDNQPEKLWLFSRKDLAYSSLDIYNQYTQKNDPTMTLEEYSSQFRKNDNPLSQNALQNIPRTHYVDMMKLICPTENTCHVLTEDQKIILYDAAHFSPEGAKYLGSFIHKFL